MVTQTAGLNRLPGDRGATVAQMLRVNQAGEYGAARIYAGQLAVLGGRHQIAGEIARMKQQEQRHLDWFDAALVARGVRPTILQPLWNIAGFALGAATALLGPRAAMACTVAVETEIDRHYQAQRDQLAGSEPELAAAIADFQAEEVEHRATALAAGAEATPGYPLLSAVIRAGCRTAIAAATRV
ncbi:MAG: demethoxyubiquinone hydroxylase family protein [Polymorphobacter sp.]